MTWAASTGTVTRYTSISTDGVNFLEIATTLTPGYTDSAVLAGKLYTYRVRAEGRWNLLRLQPDQPGRHTGRASLTSLDIAATQPGSTTAIQTGTDYNVVAGGAAIYNNSDQFRFLYAQQTGNFDVKVRINSISVSGGIDQAGIMVRTSLDPASPEIAITASPSQGYRFKYRTTQAGATTGPTTLAATSYPNVWVRLQRVGNLFTGYFSSDGVNWTSAGSLSLALPASTFLGLAAAANVTNATINVQFRSYEATSLPAPVATVTAAAVDASHENLTWAAVAGATSYLVQRKASTDADYLDLVTNIAGATYTDATVQPGQTYQYRVIAVSSAGATQAFSNPATVLT